MTRTEARVGMLVCVPDVSLAPELAYGVYGVIEQVGAGFIRVRWEDDSVCAMTWEPRGTWADATRVEIVERPR